MVTDTRQNWGGGGNDWDLMWMGIIHLYLLQVYTFPDYFFGFATVEMGWGGVGWGGVGCKIRGRVRMECVSEKRVGGDIVGMK